MEIPITLDDTLVARLAAIALGLVLVYLLVRLLLASLRSVGQAGVLLRTRRRLDAVGSGPVALHGEVRMRGPYLMRTGVTNALWWQVRHYSKPSGDLFQGSDGGGWRHVGEEISFASLSLLVDGREVVLMDCPTEVTGTRRKRVYPNGGWLFNEGTRYDVRWLPSSHRLTVVGRVWATDGDELAIGEHPVTGMLITPRSPAAALAAESMKGLLGIATVALVVGTALRLPELLPGVHRAILTMLAIS